MTTATETRQFTNSDVTFPVAKGHYVQFGCGLCAPESWINFDASPRLIIERLLGVRALIAATSGLLFPNNVKSGDIVTGLPLADGTCAGVYSSHVLEHLSRDDVPVALRNVAKLLVPGGIFRLVVPDLRWRAEEYLRSNESDSADLFLESCMMGVRKRTRTPLGLLRNCFGNSAHLWMYDSPAMKALLYATGFVDIRNCEFGDCSDPMFTHVEQPDRFVSAGHCELAIEARRK